MSLRSSRSPIDFSKQGFYPLDSSGNTNGETDIPLTPIRTAGSTGARKPGHDAINSPLTLKDDEKEGLFNRGAGGRRRATNPKLRRVSSDGEEVAVNGLGRLYSKIVNFSVVTRYFVYVLPVALIIAVPIIIFAVLYPNYTFAGTGVRSYLFWTWFEVVWLSIWASKLMAKAIPGIFMFCCGVVSSGTRKYAMILRAVEIPLSFVGWAVTVLVTFTALTSAKLNEGDSDHWVVVMKRFLGPCVIASVLFLAEKLSIQLISVNYHRRSFDLRIKESKRSVHLIGMLYEASRTLFPKYCREFIEEDYVIDDSIEAMIAKTTGHKRSGSATPLRLIGGVGRLGDRVTSVFGNIASEITGKQVFNPNSAHSIVVEALEKKRSSEALAKRLWMSLVVEGKDALYVEDLQEVLGPDRRDEADEAFSALDQDGNGDISLDEMIMKVVEIGRDRKSISASMRDVGQAIGVLDQILVTVLFVICVFIFVAFQDTSFVTTLATAGTTLLSLSFVFAVTTQEFLGSCIFLFVKHPYDVGDRVDIIGPITELLIVEQISLLFTVFKRIDNMKMVQVPNIILNTLWIENVTRSKAMKEELDMFVSFETSLADIDLLRAEIESFVRHPENSRDFQSDVILEVTGIGNIDKLQLKVEIKHKSNWHNEAVRAARRSKFMCALVLALRKIPIYAPGGGNETLGGPTNPSYSVSVSDACAAEARGKARQAKEALRLVPSNHAPSDKSPGGSLGLKDEEKAATIINARRPTVDDDDGDVDTLPSREENMERDHSNEVDNHHKGPLKREATHGRRRPGAYAPPALLTSGQSGLTLHQAGQNGEGDMGAMDEEAELGLRQSTSLQGSTYTSFSGGSNYSMYPLTPVGRRGLQAEQQLGAPGANQPHGRRTTLSVVKDEEE